MRFAIRIGYEVWEITHMVGVICIRIGIAIGIGSRSTGGGAIKVATRGGEGWCARSSFVNVKTMLTWWQTRHMDVHLNFCDGRICFFLVRCLLLKSNLTDNPGGFRARCSQNDGMCSQQVS